MGWIVVATQFEKSRMKWAFATESQATAKSRTHGCVRQADLRLIPALVAGKAL